MRRFRYFVSGCILSAFIFGAVNVYAENPDTVTAFLGRIKLMVNGEEIKGETLLYNDTTYIPLKAVAETLGKEVAYNDATKTAYIDEEGTARQQMIDVINSDMTDELKALELVKYHIAGDDPNVFESLITDKLTYYYKGSNYKIQYSNDLGGNIHLIQEYESVIDDSETKVGHTVTHNWYHVDITTGNITAMFYNENFLTSDVYRSSAR